MVLDFSKLALQEMWRRRVVDLPPAMVDSRPTLHYHEKSVRCSPHSGPLVMTDIGPVYEERSFKWAGSDEQPTSQAKQRLIFPRSDKNALLQSSAWQPRGTDNRIKIILSEGLIREDSSLEAACCDIVCFSFQHASRGLNKILGIDTAS